MAVSYTTKVLKDIMRIDAGINGDAQYIEQITWMLFLKAFDYKEREWEKTEADYYPVVPREYRWSQWAENPDGITGDALLDHIGNLFSTLRALDLSGDGKNRKRLIRNVMDGSNNFMKSGSLLRQVINRINEEIDFAQATTMHLFNDLYETMLKDLQSAGKAGEFYTPRAVTHFIVEMVNPKPGEVVLDPACGTGGFLTSVIDRYSIKSPEDHRLLQSTIRGIEKKPFPYLLCVTNLIMHGIDVPDIRHENTLQTDCGSYTQADLVDIIVTNPPFGGAEEKSISGQVPRDLRTTETADLFLVHIMSMLRDGGRCGLVLPDGFLFGTGVKSAVKKKLLEEHDLHTVIRLPRDVFAPYTNINTNLLFFTKGGPTQGVWYYRLEMPEGYKHFSKTKPMCSEHFDPVRKWWSGRREGPQSRYVPVAEIQAADYNLDLCGFPRETVEAPPPEEFIRQYRQRKAELSGRIDAILDRICAAMDQGGAK